MKKIAKITFFVFFIYVFNVWAYNYNYNFKDTTDNPVETDSSQAGGKLDYNIKMKAWINDNNTLTAKIEKYDGSKFDSGKMYFQKDSNSNLDNNIIMDKDVSNNDYSITFITEQTLNDIDANWSNNKMVLYARYENSNGYAWAGPIEIERTISNINGNIQVYIEPSEARLEGAQWRSEISAGANNWTEWYDSNVKVDNLKPGETRIQFKPISERWKTPQETTVTIREGQTTTTRATYIFSISSIHVTIEPESAILAGAKWRVEIGDDVWTTYYDSGMTIPGFPPGPVNIQYKGLNGWDSPDIQTVVVTESEAAIASGMYCKQIADPPEQIIVSKGDDTSFIFIDWEDLFCVTQYTVFRNTEDVFGSSDLLAVVESSQYVDKTANPGQKYYYWVKSEYLDYGTGDYSLSDHGFTKIKSPENVVAGDGDHFDKTRITWALSAGADSYEIFRNTDTNPDSAELIATVDTTSYDDTSADPLKKYFYFVKAKNDNSRSDYSNYDEGYTDLQAPEGVMATDGTFFDKVIVTWNKVKGAIGYIVGIKEYDTKKRSDSTIMESVGPVETSFEHLTGDCGKRYWYYVIAYNKHGQSITSSVDSGYREMAKPSISIDSCSNDSIVRIKWNNVDSARYYHVYRSISDDFSKATKISPESGLIGNYFDDVTSNRMYFYWVVAHNDYTSSVSAPVEGGNDLCTVNIEPIYSEFDYNGGNGDITITASSSYNWHAISNVDWISISSSSNGFGSSILSYELAENTSLEQRKGSITIGNKIFNIAQEGKPKLTLKVDKQGIGKVKINGNLCLLPWQERFVMNERICLEPVPEDNWDFNYWVKSDGVDSDDNLCFNITEETTITGVFGIEKYTLSLSIDGGNGKVIIDDSTELDFPVSDTFERGKVVILKAIGVNNSNFLKWTGDVEGIENPLDNPTTVIIDKDKNITAKFEEVGGWITEITTVGVDYGGQYVSTISIGVLPGDETKIPAAPLPPAFSVSSEIIDLPDWSSQLATSTSKAGAEEYSWVISINPHGNQGAPDDRTAITSWKSESLNPEGYYEILKGYDGNGEVAVADMRSITSMEITGGDTSQYFTIIWKSKKDNGYAERITIKAEAENLGGQYQRSISIGIGEKSSIPAPPCPPNFSTDMYILPDWTSMNSVDIKAIIEQIADEEITYSWVVAVNPHGNMGSPLDDATTILSWKADEFYPYSNVNYIMKKGYDLSGDTVIADMRKITSLEVTGGNSYQYFTIIRTTKQIVEEQIKCIEITLMPGWNLISIPLIAEDNSLESMFPDASVAYEYSNGGYISVDKITPGHGFWISVDKEVTYEICGKPFVSYTKTLSNSWHLMGTTYNENEAVVPESDVEDCLEVMYIYENGSYTMSYDIEMGQGFWIRAKEECVFKLGQ